MQSCFHNPSVVRAEPTFAIFRGKRLRQLLLPNYLARYTVRPWFNEVKSRPCDRLGRYCHVSLPALGQRTPVWPNQMPMARTAIDGEDQRRGV
jgi:hypothetical protein